MYLHSLQTRKHTPIVPAEASTANGIAPGAIAIAAINRGERPIPELPSHLVGESHRESPTLQQNLNQAKSQGGDDNITTLNRQVHTHMYMYLSACVHFNSFMHILQHTHTHTQTQTHNTQHKTHKRIQNTNLTKKVPTASCLATEFVVKREPSAFCGSTTNDQVREDNINRRKVPKFENVLISST